jgi:uncharacterized protein YjbI with pentapeptide repeats
MWRWCAYLVTGHFGGNNVATTVAANSHRLQGLLGSERVPSGRPMPEVLPASTLLTASSAVILPAPILKPKWVQYEKQHRKVDTRGLTIVHLTGMHLTGVHLTGVHLTGVHLIGACISQGVHLMGVHLMNVPLSWASLAGLFRGCVAAPAP